MILTISNLNKYYGAEHILQDINAVIHEGNRIGLVGANGEGKTTLLNIIAGGLDFESGTLSTENSQIGYLQQNTKFTSNSSIMEEMRAVFSDLLAIKDELTALQHEMGELDPDSDRYHRLAEEYSAKNTYFEQKDGYTIDVKINTVLNGMGFQDYNKDTRVDVLSGGEKTRLALARLLLIQPDLLILDEPTNHLDFRTLNWLEEYLASYKGAILVVSHDRYFLDRLVNHVWEIENRVLSCFNGNYSAYVRQKKERVERQLKEYEQQQQQIHSMQDFVQRNIARASTSKSAKSRLAALDRMEIIEKPYMTDKRANFRFVSKRQPVKDILHVKNLSLSVGSGIDSKEICSGIDLDVLRGDKIAFIGPNGVGKSSLLKALQGLIPCRSERLQWGRNVDISYFEQENRQLNKEKTALDQIWDTYPKMYEQEVRSWLGRVLFSGEDVFKKVGDLSGGERARVAFCLMMLEEGNVLILDEPTNHLDISAKEQLEDALAEYDGTIIMVSHDRYLLNKIPTAIVEMSPQGLTVYEGRYDSYLAKSKAAAQQQAAAAVPEKKEPRESENAAKFYRSKKERARQVAMKNRLSQLEKLIEQTEQSISDNEKLMSDPQVAGDYQKLQEVCNMLEEQRAQLDSYTEEWMLLGEELEALGQV